MLRTIYFDVKVPTFPVQYYIQATEEQNHISHSWNPCISGFGGDFIIITTSYLCRRSSKFDEKQIKY